MKSTTILRFTKFGACMVLLVGLHGVASAACGDTLSAMAAGGVVVLNESHPIPAGFVPNGSKSGHTSIVGLWHIEFVSNGQTIQEAYQIWSTGGTEVHNPNVDPRGGSVCLGVWKRHGGTFSLAHRVWNYDGNGTFMGTIHLSESVTVSADGKTQSGSFALDFFDPAGNFQFEVPGTVTGERISVD
jgi:hypothetical protein